MMDYCNKQEVQEWAGYGILFFHPLTHIETLHQWSKARWRVFSKEIYKRREREMSVGKLRLYIYARKSGWLVCVCTSVILSLVMRDFSRVILAYVERALLKSRESSIITRVNAATYRSIRAFVCSSRIQRSYISRALECARHRSGARSRILYIARRVFNLKWRRSLACFSTFPNCISLEFFSPL